MSNFIGWGEFTTYMDKFKAELKEELAEIKGDLASVETEVSGLGREVSEMRGRYEAKGNGYAGKGKPDHIGALINVLKYILVLIAGGFLALGGASWGQNVIKILGGGG